MVRLDIDVGALVTLRFQHPYAPDDERAYLDALQSIGHIEEPFVLLTIFGGGPGLSQAGEREQALWFKATRARLDARCRAMAIVRPGASDTMAAVFRKLWSFPIIATEDEAEGRAFIAKAQAGEIP